MNLTWIIIPVIDNAVKQSVTTKQFFLQKGKIALILRVPNPVTLRGFETLVGVRT